MAHRAAGKFLPLAFVALALVRAPQTSAAVTPELQRTVREATFEVVLKKPTTDPLKYEKPLPLELLPYRERTDLYRSIGTAFSLGHSTYVTAAHVLAFSVDSQYGAPMLRAADGKVYAVRSILKYSANEDFAVFTLESDPASQGLDISRTPKVDDAVLAVGDALGEGIVMRDGLFTSQTPEVQEGRWQWIRFSAAASPGNSGGPLLDGAGRVIGVITAKSPNENLNYALPIANVLDAPANKARFDGRALMSLPFLHGTKTYELKDAFDLPLDWPAFSRAYQALNAKHNDASRRELLTAYADSLFPKGAGSDTVLYQAALPTTGAGLLMQEANGQWDVHTAEFKYTDLPSDGKVGHALVAGAILLHLERGGAAADDGFYGDSKSFMDIALQALDLRRPVGTDSVRVVSLGAAQSDVQYTDHFGRKWQHRIWALPFFDRYLVGYLLPTPEGYVALLQYAPSSMQRPIGEILSAMCDEVTTPYAGTLGQWQAFLHRSALLPQALTHASLEPDPTWRLTTARFQMSVPASVLSLSAHSRLLLTTGFIPEGSAARWDVTGAWWYRDSEEKAWVGMWRQALPPTSAKRELRDAFDDLKRRKSPFDGQPVRITADSFSVSTMLQAPGSKSGTVSSDLVYGLTIVEDGHVSMQSVSLSSDAAQRGMRILEQGSSTEIASAAPPSFASNWESQIELARSMTSQYAALLGKDIRGRTVSQDVDDYLVVLAKGLAQSTNGLVPTVAGGAAIGPTAIAAENVEAEWKRRSESLQAYWNFAPALVHNRDVWSAFLQHNRLPDNTSHEAKVLEAEEALEEELKQYPPRPSWVERARALNGAYISERRHLAGKMTRDPSLAFHPRSTACPQKAQADSGKERARLQSVGSDLREYYPMSLRREGIEGTVVLAVRVDSDGCAKESVVAGSSGMDEFDQAALKWIETAHFLPAARDGRRVESETPIAIAFTLDD